MNRFPIVRPLSLAALAAVAASCSGGSSDQTGPIKTGGNFVVLSTEPLNNGRLFLNDPISLDFSNLVDLSSADLNTISFQVLDQNGTPLSEQPTGRFELGVRPGDTSPGRRLQFVPRFPTNDTYDNGGFRPGRTYLVRLVAGSRVNGTVLRDQSGRGLDRAETFRFTTADGTAPAQLFRNRLPGGPRRLDFTITPSPDGGVALNKLGSPPVELRLTFDQPLNPNSANVPTALDTNPLRRSINDRGRIFLEYNDPEFGNNTWIPADVELEVNDLERSVVLLRPVGVLPNNAEVRVIVENTLEDISGESNVANAAYSRVFATFRTRPDYQPQFDALVEEFRTAEQIDQNAPFLEPFAEIGQGYIRAGFAFEGSRTELEFEPRTQEVVLNTDFTQVVPKVGTPFNVSGGVFNFKNVTIPQGVQVFGRGTRPMVWLVSGDFRVAGTLSVRGGDGGRVDTLNSANFPSAGGVGVCTGGNGGRGSPNSTNRSMLGEAGFGALQVPGGGGRGGQISCVAGCGRGSGGGGGSLATQGDPWYKQQAGAGTTFQQQRGIGGQGCQGGAGATTRNLAGGEAGPIVFRDARTDNNFWGVGINVNRQLRIRGELANPIGGSGGGGGGDLSNSEGCNTSTVNFVNDSKGGGGGGGGGVLIVKALGRIIIEATGTITADGGFGGGGEQAGSCNQGGGGGAGAGGMVILMAGREIELNARGVPAQNRYTYAQNDYSFSVSADGGVCTTGTFSALVVSAKYPASGQTVQAGTSYDSAPLGALGGMGVVQLMAPPGNPDPAVPQPDNTNTVLDDNIRVYQNSVEVFGQTKIQLLAWRGFPNANGVLVDDFGVETNIGANEGDIRPAPILLPVPFSSKTRLRSNWIDTGASRRRALVSTDGLPRGIVEDPVNNLRQGPAYSFSAITNDPTSPAHGYVSYQQTGGDSVRIDYGTPISGDILRMDAGASFQGQPAYRVELTAGVLGNIVDRYSQYECELKNNQGTVLSSLRILTHTDRVLLLDAVGGLLPGEATRVDVLAKFFRVTTNGAEGLGPTYAGSIGGTRVPSSNVRIGFAFHRNPATALQSGNDPNRFPTRVGTFAYNLTDPAVIEELRQFGATYLQWDVLFDTAFKSVAADVPPAFGPVSPRGELRFLRMPFRF